LKKHGLLPFNRRGVTAETGGVIRLRKGSGGLRALGDQPLISRSRPDNNLEMVVAQATCAEMSTQPSRAVRGFTVIGQ
jgi:hypothetical protein